MATADELLSTIDTDKTLIIDKDLRTIIIPSSVKNLGVESDDDVLRLKFSMPRMYGDVDLSDFSIYINYMNAKNTGDVYVVDDKTIADDTITFSWLVGRVALTYKGNVRFIVCMKKYDNDSNIIQEYNTTIASLPVLEGLETGETIVQQYPDIIEMLLSSSGTTDHSKLGNRDVADQHPISAITGLEEALTPLTGTTETLTPMQVYVAIKSGKSVVLQHTNSKFGLFTFASFNIFEGEKVVVSTSIAKETGGTYLVGSLAGNAGVDAGWAGWIFNATTMAEADDIPVAVNEALAQAKESGEFDGAAGKSAYAYAQDGGYTGTEEQFAAKLAKEKFANPYALTFTGAVEGSYDGSAPLTVNIPEGGGGTGGSSGLETAAEAQLATGTITPVEATTYTPTGVTLGDLRKYRRFVFVWKGASNTGADNMMLQFSTAAPFREEIVRWSEGGMVCMFEWCDAEKTLLRTCVISGGNPSMVPSVGSTYIKHSTYNRSTTGLMFGAEGMILFSTKLAGLNDSSELFIANFSKITIDYRWEIRGVTI